jgi:hypothetical protein
MVAVAWAVYETLERVRSESTGATVIVGPAPEGGDLDIGES